MEVSLLPGLVSDRCFSVFMCRLSNANHLAFNVFFLGLLLSVSARAWNTSLTPDSQVRDFAEAMCIHTAHFGRLLADFFLNEL